ncbi:MAG: recombinase family protein [Bacilli bacterium]|nr:recombinase family protein [Bacilli bacterium]
MKKICKKDFISATYTREGKEEQLDNRIKNKTEDKNDKNTTGIYIRSRCEDEEGLQYNIASQISRLEEYCKKNNIVNIIKYVDIGMGANFDDRPALRKMIEDIDKGIINKIIVTSPDRLFRDLQKMYNFADKCFSKDIEVISLDTEPITDILFFSDEIENAIRKARENIEKDIEY